MSAYLDPDTFILADDLLREVMGALAEGHATLAKKSRSPVGTLVVKEAEVAVEFDFSVQARETSQGVGLRVRPPAGGGFFLVPGIEATQAKTQTDIINRARVTVKIVNVLPPEEATPKPPLPDRPPTKPDPEEPPPDDPPRTLAEALKMIRTVLGYLETKLPEAAKVLKVRVDEIEEATAEGDEKSARRGIVAFVADVRTVLKQHEGPVPDQITEMLRQLAATYASDDPAADTLRVYNRDRIASLEPMLMEAGVKATARRAFAEHATAALDSERTMAARAVLAVALHDLTPELAGTVLPVAFFDQLDKLGLRDALEATDGAWRVPFEASINQLRDLVAGFDLPRRPLNTFEKGIGEVLTSQSAVEAGSRLMAVLDALREDTASLDLPAVVRDTLDHLGRTPST